jgi:aminoglycoside phosphotransferase (APT) family kinase protein
MSSTGTRLVLSAANVADYLRGRGVLPAGAEARVAPLSGGISNVVLRVDWAEGSVVVKQSLPALRVEERWEFDPARIVVERKCMVALGTLLPAGAVPAVIDADDRELVLTMSCAPDGGVVWKDALLRGELDPAVARRAGELLGRVHAGSAGDEALAESFDDLMPLVEGRIAPYHRTAARAHPDLAALIEADAERLMTQRRALVLGDYSPKNLISYPDRLLVLDFEVAHWGDPAFDAAFMLTHLALKAVHLRERHAEYLAAARAVWDAYSSVAGAAGAYEADVVNELGVLLICRVDGMSRAEYLDEPSRALVRELGRTVLTGDERSLAVLDLIGERI